MGKGKFGRNARNQRLLFTSVQGLTGTSVSMVLGLRLKGFGVRGLLSFFWQGSGT